MKLTCNTCNKEFKGYCYSIKSYCSRDCYYKSKKGSGNHNWVGIGKPFFIKHHNRYMITVNGVKIKYARYLMEQHLGRKIKKDEVVHHINGDSSDDRIENLQVLKRRDHSIHHNPKKSWINTPCKNCGKETFRYDGKVKKNHFCSRKCINIYVKPRKPNGKIVECTNCKKEVYKRPSELKHAKNPFCSVRCGTIFNRPRLGTGKNHPKSPKPKSR